MLLRRLLLVLVAGLALAGIVWAATLIGFAPAPNSPEPNAGAPERPPPAASYAAEVAEPPPGRRGAIDYSRIDERLARLMERPEMVGLAVAIVEEGEIRFLKGYGETAAGSGEPVTADTVFRWASLSKGVAGDMVALLAGQERLSLHEPVSRYSWSLRLPGGNEHVATLSDLLSHRLGIFAHAEDSKLEDGHDARRLRSELGRLNSICPVGQCHAYQNVAFDAASEAVERVTGRPYFEAVREHLFLPLGMTSASMSLEGLVGSPSWARPHVGRRTIEEIKDAYYRVPAAGGVNGSIKDLGLWMLAQMGLAPGVIPEAVLAAAHAELAATPREDARRRKFQERIRRSSYGLGWRIFDYAGHRVVGHRGGVRGYRSLILFDPARRTGVAALWNSSTARPGGLEYEVMDMLYRLPFRDWLELGDAPGAESSDEIETLHEGS